MTALARQEGISLDRARTERITAAAREFNQVAKLEMINLAAERVREMLEDGRLTPSQLKDVVLTGAILIDKRAAGRCGDGAGESGAHRPPLHSR